MATWKSRLTVAASLAATTALLLTAPAGFAAAASNVTLSGNSNSALLSSSTNEGPADPSAVMDLSIALKTGSFQGMTLAQFVQATQDETSAYYHQFLSSQQFKSDFSPSDTQVQQVVDFLQQNGFTVTDTLSNNLVIQATAPVGVVESTFNVKINQYLKGKQTFVGNASDPQVPPGIADLILGIAGMTTYSNLASQAVNQQSFTLDNPATTMTSTGAPASGPGSYGPSMVRTFYNITPLYQAGFTGQGETIGIATLANFDPPDAIQYWTDYGVPHGENRITVVPVDGGFPADVHQPGAGETTLDVEQSGSMAPNAKILVYEAPNTNTGFIDLFYTVAASDAVNTMSVSWGEDESNETPAYHQMMNQAFEEGAAEGISMFAAAGDDGAYDNGGQQLGVDSPASDPYITAAGGTTYPGPILFNLTSHQTEHAWGWDYLLPFYSFFGYHNQQQWQNQIYPVGGGGGISTVWPTPWYQQGVSGASTTGRNVPDIALNADPFTGYALYDTFGPGNTGWSIGWGGTSFVAPEMAGITAVIDSKLGANQGLLNPALYRLATSANAYNSKTSPFHEITKGDNWYYYASPGYNNASGIGSLNVANLANSLANMQ